VHFAAFPSWDRNVVEQGNYGVGGACVNLILEHAPMWYFMPMGLPVGSLHNSLRTKESLGC